MNFKNLIIFTALASATVLSSCDGYKTADEGIKYKIIVDSAGPTIELGGAVVIDMTYTNERDTFDTKKANRGMPFLIPMPPSIVEKASLERGLTMLSKGDSASFIISTDSLYGLTRKELETKGIKEGSVTTFYIRIKEVLSKDSVKLLREKMMNDKLAQDMQRQAIEKMLAQQDSIAIADYCKKKGLKPKRTLDGVYYVVTRPGLGFTLQPGDSVSTFYSLKLLDGKEIQSNFGKEPFKLTLGVGEVIPGWDSGLMALKKGEKATLIIPSRLGYGPQGNRDIAPNSVLVFDVEILK